jgi:hypothetical protein
MIDLATIVADFADGMRLADGRKPQAANARTGAPFSPGLGPHTEAQTISLVLRELSGRSGYYATSVYREVPYPESPRSKCDLCFGGAPDFSWAIEVKMLRLMGDNGKPNDNILMHILSPYPAHRSALTDCEKLRASGLRGRKAIVIYAYEYPEWPAEPAIAAFEVLAERGRHLSERHQAMVTGLIHPVHREARVYGWELLGNGSLR